MSYKSTEYCLLTGTSLEFFGTGGTYHHMPARNKDNIGFLLKTHFAAIFVLVIVCCWWRRGGSSWLFLWLLVLILSSRWLRRSRNRVCLLYLVKILSSIVGRV